MVLNPNLTFDDETNLMAALGHSVAFMKQLAENSTIPEDDYWDRRADDFTKLYDKLSKLVYTHS